MPAKPQTKQTLPEFIEDLKAPEIFASVAPYFSISDGSVTIMFASKRWDNGVSPAVLKNVAVARVVMPLVGLQGMVVGLHTFLEKHGFGLVKAEERQRPQ